MTANEYLNQVLLQYKPADLSTHISTILHLKTNLVAWANTCHLGVLDSGSRAKGTAISLASDVDYLVSLTSACNDGAEGGSLKATYESLYETLKTHYPNAEIRKQNVSVRIKINSLEIDITPAKKMAGNTNYHNLYSSKTGTRKQTNIQKHINEVGQSGRTNEVKLLKIWRELHHLDMPSIYLEFLLINEILLNKSLASESLSDNFLFALQELGKDENNPLFKRVVDPANSNNILSDLLSNSEKILIISKAKLATNQKNWGSIIW